MLSSKQQPAPAIGTTASPCRCAQDIDVKPLLVCQSNITATCLKAYPQVFPLLMSIRHCATGVLDPMSKQPFDLVAIFKSCPRPPPQVAALLQQQGVTNSGAGDGARTAISNGATKHSGRLRIGLSKRHSGAPQHPAAVLAWCRSAAALVPC